MLTDVEYLAAVNIVLAEFGAISKSIRVDESVGRDRFRQKAEELMHDDNPAIRLAAFDFLHRASCEEEEDGHSITPLEPARENAQGGGG